MRIRLSWILYPLSKKNYRIIVLEPIYPYDYNKDLWNYRFCLTEPDCTIDLNKYGCDLRKADKNCSNQGRIYVESAGSMVFDESFIHVFFHQP